MELPFLWRPVLRDADDDRVLETAMNGGADLLLTFNLRDFAQASEFGVTARMPGPAWRELEGVDG